MPNEIVAGSVVIRSDDPADIGVVEAITGWGRSGYWPIVLVRWINGTAFLVEELSASQLLLAEEYRNRLVKQLDLLDLAVERSSKNKLGAVSNAR